MLEGEMKPPALTATDFAAELAMSGLHLHRMRYGSGETWLTL